MATDINIAGRLHSMASGNVVAGADEILDDTLGKKQSAINQELYQGAGRPQLNTEDLDYNSDNQLQFADRLYDSESTDGMGYKILRQGDGLTFANQVTDTNTIYEIRNEFDLNDPTGENPVSLPSGSVLRFNGGSVTNGALRGTIDIENMPSDFLANVDCRKLVVKSMKHLSLGDVSDTFDNYRNGIVSYRHEQNIKGSAHYYDITGLSKLYVLSSTSYPSIRLVFYDENLDYVGVSDWTIPTTYEVSVPAGAKYVTFILAFSIGQIPTLEAVLKNISFSFLDCARTYISDEMRFGRGGVPDSLSISTTDVTNTYIRPTQKDFKLTDSVDNSSICIPYNVFKYYDYLTITANGIKGSRVHFLKEEPTANNQLVSYSDYYLDNIGFGFDNGKKLKIDFAIPKDARYIYVLNRTSGNNNTPDSITLRKRTIPDKYIVQYTDSSNRNMNQYTMKFMHWNIGNFSNGSYPYPNSYEGSDVTNKYNPRKTAFQTFLSTYASDCHFLLNEYNEVFANVNGEEISTPSVVFSNVKAGIVCPRSSSTGYNKLAAFLREGLRSDIYKEFESLKGVISQRGTFEYGVGYTLTSYSIGSVVLYVMSLHAPNHIGNNSELDYIHDPDYNDALYDEILSIVSDYANVILVGDFNRGAPANFSKFTNAGFTILNEVDEPIKITHPARNAEEQDSTLDWVLYKCSQLTVSDFYVYQTETVYHETGSADDKLLSDHYPLSFTVTRNTQSNITKNTGNYRYNIATNTPQWYNGEEWFSFNTSGETPTIIANNTDLDSIVDIGQYYSNSADKTNTLLHKPADLVSGGFQMFVRPIAGDGSARVMQILKGNYTNAPIYIRRSQNDKTFSLGWEKIDCYTVGTSGGTTAYDTTNYYYGDSTNRANVTSNVSIGHKYFDTTLGKPIFWNGTQWVYADGTAVS